MNDQPLDNPTTDDEGMNRRSFLKYAGAGLGALVVIELGGIGFAYLQPRLAEGDFGSIITAGAVDDFPPGSVTQIINGRFYLTRFDDGGFLAIHQRCTHLGCTVPWEQSEQLFICPCHNSQFDDAGTVLNPPAPRPLDLFEVIIANAIVSVDTGAALARDAFDLSQVVYP
ncbi:MAG: Rieske 2Fe-2S domain-containing protein [Actinomycetia bacterium]|nr:Rieske 2Fe-2S domain-containing protein [Actinomycetes bacterium]